MNDTEPKKSRDFIREVIDRDRAEGKHEGRVHTRFPPEPNGYLHIGHAKAICTNFGIADEYKGKVNLRFDDTNPVKEETEFVDAIKADIQWLGFNWDSELYASDYFDQMYEYAEMLVRQGDAYVCDLTPEQVKEYRGTLTEPGRESPYRNRAVEENLELLRGMRNGDFPEGSRTLRARIDMASPNMNMRDPAIYRILHRAHHRTGSDWCIYPMYDYAHCLEDSIEGITHSLCSLEFEDHRPLYDWFLTRLDVFHPQQIEFARLNMTYTVLSKRFLRGLVENGVVSGWDDPRMPTLRGMRRRGIPPGAVRQFCDRIGLAKRDSMVDIALLEHIVRETLNSSAPRVMAVLNPIRLLVENYPAGQVEMFDYQINPEDESAGTRSIPFCRELFIEREDFMETPLPKFFRLSPGAEVRLRYAYLVKATGVERNAEGEVTTVRCTYDPESRGGNSPDGRRVKATLHWVSADHSIPAVTRLYDRLFRCENPLGEDGELVDHLNPESLVTRADCRVESHMASARPEQNFQFERMGYFCVDADSGPNRMVFNRTISLRDTWDKIRRKQ
ncbi:MAG: glutamine--tRNA ligase/YqeY domain fusion protein [Candidatus Fermentibacteraceae bacterium]